jgi:NAD-dependent deacetylase
MLRPVITDAADLIRNAHNLAVLTGAGVSTDCGIPDFRGPNGVWTLNPELQRMSNLTAFKSDPDVRTHHWTNEFYASLPSYLPGPAHIAIHDLNPGLVITQNIDGLHLKAGDGPVTVEMHGTYASATCLNGWHTVDSDDILRQMDAGDLPTPPHCPNCGPDVPLKRDIVLFGENLDQDKFDRVETFLAERCDVLLCVGTTLSVWPVAGFPSWAKRHGAKVIIINDDLTSAVDNVIAIVRAEHHRINRLNLSAFEVLKKT